MRFRTPAIATCALSTHGRIRCCRRLVCRYPHGSATRCGRSGRGHLTHEALRTRLRAPAVDGRSPSRCRRQGVLQALHRDGDRTSVVDGHANDRRRQRMSCDGDDESGSAKCVAHGAVPCMLVSHASNVGCGPSALTAAHRCAFAGKTAMSQGREKVLQDRPPVGGDRALRAQRGAHKAGHGQPGAACPPEAARLKAQAREGDKSSQRMPRKGGPVPEVIGRLDCVANGTWHRFRFSRDACSGGEGFRACNRVSLPPAAVWPDAMDPVAAQ